MELNIWNVLVREKIPEILIELLNNNDAEDKYAHYLAKKIDITYSHLVKIIYKLKEADLIFRESHGRINVITLTRKGKQVAEHFSEIKKILTTK